MAYNQANLFSTEFRNVSGSWRMWGYRSADPLATVVAAGYVSNATEMGMKVGDTVLVLDTNTAAQAWARVTAITAGASTMSAGLAIT